MVVVDRAVIRRVKSGTRTGAAAGSGRVWLCRTEACVAVAAMRWAGGGRLAHVSVVQKRHPRGCGVLAVMCAVRNAAHKARQGSEAWAWAWDGSVGGCRVLPWSRADVKRKPRISHHLQTAEVLLLAKAARARFVTSRPRATIAGGR